MLSNLRNTTQGYTNTYNAERLEMSKRIGQILIAIRLFVIYMTKMLKTFVRVQQTI